MDLAEGLVASHGKDDKEPDEHWLNHALDDVIDPVAHTLVKKLEDAQARDEQPERHEDGEQRDEQQGVLVRSVLENAAPRQQRSATRQFRAKFGSGQTPRSQKIEAVRNTIPVGTCTAHRRQLRQSRHIMGEAWTRQTALIIEDWHQTDL